MVDLKLYDILNGVWSVVLYGSGLGAQSYELLKCIFDGNIKLDLLWQTEIKCHENGSAELWQTNQMP
jgi:hypothetical protein